MSGGEAAGGAAGSKTLIVSAQNMFIWRGREGACPHALRRLGTAALPESGVNMMGKLYKQRAG